MINLENVDIAIIELANYLYAYTDALVNVYDLDNYRLTIINCKRSNFIITVFI